MNGFLVFWWHSFCRSWMIGYNVFAFIEAVCALLAAGLLVHRRLAKKAPTNWEKNTRKLAWLLLIGTLVVSALIVSPFLEAKEEKAAHMKREAGLNAQIQEARSTLNKLEQQGPLVLLESFRLEDGGKSTDGNIRLTCVLRNYGTTAVQNVELLFGLVSKYRRNSPTLLRDQKSAYGFFPPGRSLEAGLTVGLIETPSGTEPQNEVVLMVSFRYRHPVTNFYTVVPPQFEKFKLVQATKSLMKEGLLTLNESKDYFELVRKDYEQFRDTPPQQ